MPALAIDHDLALIVLVVLDRQVHFVDIVDECLLQELVQDLLIDFLVAEGLEDMMPALPSDEESIYLACSTVNELRFRLEENLNRSDGLLTFRELKRIVVLLNLKLFEIR